MSRTAVAVSVLACALLIAPIARTQPNNANVAPGRFICLVEDGEDAFAIGQRAVEATGGTLGHVYTHALKGFSIGVPPGIVIANLRAQKGVMHVEPDMIVHTCADPIIPTGIDRIDAEGVDFTCEDAGIAIIDTGIDGDHPDLNVQDGVRYYLGGTGPPWKRTVTEDDNFDDDAGHGTHCAGIAAASGGIVGVAPGARLYAVKVLDSSGSGYMSAIAAGIDWLTREAGNLGIQVANMSLGGQGESDALFTAMSKCPVTFTVSAGNSGKDIYGPDGEPGGGDDFIPAAYGGKLDNVLTISALADSDGEPGGLGGSTSYGADDSFASFSNYSAAGAIAYILPGVDIRSTYMGGGYATMSGTSMAAPHAAGLIALNIAGGVFTSYAQNDGTYGLIQPSGDPDDQYEPLGYSIYPTGGTGDASPTITITSPPDGATFDSGVSISFEGTASDDEDGDLTSSIAWTSSLDNEIGTGGSPSASLTDGTHTITASVTDTGGNKATDSVTVTVGNTTPPVETDMYVWNLDGIGTWVNPAKWKAEVTVTVDDGDSAWIEGATVSGTFEPGGSASGVTNATGLCTITSGSISKREPGTVFTITDIVKDGCTYVEDSDWTEVAVDKP
jgi:subtilisin